MIEAETRDQGVHFRSYTAGDKGVLLAGFDELLVSRAGLQTIRQRFGWECNRGQFEKILDDDEIVRILATSPIDQELMGWGEYVVDKAVPGKAELLRLVMPEHQGRGVGTALIGHLIDQCRDQNPGVTRIESFTHPTNAAAINSLTKAQKIFGGRRVDLPRRSLVRFRFNV